MIKVLGLTTAYAKQVTVTLGWQAQAFFEGDAPAKERLIALEFPSLEPPAAAPVAAVDEEDDGEWSDGEDEDREAEDADDIEDEAELYNPFTAGAGDYLPPVLAYLRKHADSAAPPETGKKRSRSRETLVVPAGLWRYAALDDLLDAANADDFRWYVSQQFSLAEMESFLERHLPEAQRTLRAALAHPDAEARRNALERAQKPLERVAAIFAGTPQRIQLEVQKERERLDRALIREAKKAAKAREGGTLALSVDEWLDLMPRLKTDAGKEEAVRMIGRDLAKMAQSPAEVLEAIERLGKITSIRNRTRYEPRFWRPLEKLVTLEPTVTGKEIDLSRATEETVTLGWEVLRAKRVGAITPGRTALVVRDDNYRPKFYIRGERKLKFQVQKAGGTLERFGCTLTMPTDEDARRMEKLLLDVERIDALANVDPAAALAMVPSVAELPETHPVRRAAREAAADFRQARVLADLLIELHTGVDADVIRQMARARRRGNRR